MSEGYWLIVRVLSGHPFRVADNITDLGIEAYCPRYIVRHRHRYDRKRINEFKRVLFPGYIFAAEPFDVSRINRSPIKTRLMAKDGIYLLVTPIEMERVREAEASATKLGLAQIDTGPKRTPMPWRIEKLVKAMEGVGAAPEQFVNLGDLQRKVAS